jgi:hypothetical protein
MLAKRGFGRSIGDYRETNCSKGTQLCMQRLHEAPEMRRNASSR